MGLVTDVQTNIMEKNLLAQYICYITKLFVRQLMIEFLILTQCTAFMGTGRETT